MNILRRIWIKTRLFWNPTKVVIQGSCKMCGTCCRSLILTDGEKIVQSEEAFDALKKQYPQYEIFKFKSINNDGDWVFECTKLAADSICSIHEGRPGICANYPTRAMFGKGGKLYKNCGYHVEPAIAFKDILKSHPP